MIWGEWLTRIKDIFRNIYISPLIYTTKILGILDQFPQDTRQQHVRIIVKEFIDKLGSWAYFNGASHDKLSMGSAGGIIYFFILLGPNLCWYWEEHI